MFTVSASVSETGDMSTLTAKSVVRSASGQSMPVIGLGTWQSSGPDLEAALDAALQTGYRLIDTAYLYRNEDVIGPVLARWFASGKLKREDIFITTKLPPFANNAKYVRQYLTKQLEALQLTYVDLYLVHSLVGLLPEMAEGSSVDWAKPKLDLETDLVSLWEEMEKQVDDGLAKAIGVSNFNTNQIERILNAARIKPFNLQIEWHVYLQSKGVQAFCTEKGITITSYGTLGSPGSPDFLSGPKVNAMEDPVIQTIAKNHNKSTGQVLLRHAIQSGIAVIPKSTKPERLKENYQVFDFTLSQSEMEELNALDKGEKGRRFVLDGLKGHPEYTY